MSSSDSMAYIGLGSNLDDPVTQINNALKALAVLPDCCLRCTSRLYRSDPMGPADQPDYVNAVASLSTRLDPFSLLDRLQAIEQQHGRQRGGLRWGPRTLDLDLLLYDKQIMHTDRLILPHAGLRERAFVLYPLYDCAPDLVLPDGEALTVLLANCSFKGLNRITV